MTRSACTRTCLRSLSRSPCISFSAFFCPHSAPLILANHKVALPWPSWLAMWKNEVFSQSLHFEKSVFKEHAAERACAFVQSGQKNAALAALKHSLQLGSQKNSPYAALIWLFFSFLFFFKCFNISQNGFIFPK